MTRSALHNTSRKTKNQKLGLILTGAILMTFIGCQKVPVNQEVEPPVQPEKKKVSKILDYIEPLAKSDPSQGDAPFSREAIIEIVKKARKSESPKRETLLIQATHTALNQDLTADISKQWPEQVKLASKIYELIDTHNLTDQGDIDYYYELIGLELAVAKRNKPQATLKLKALDSISSSRKIPLTTKHYLTDSRIRASAISLEGDHMAAARLLVSRVEGVNIPNDQRQLLHDHAWHYLSLHRQTLEDEKENQSSTINFPQVASEEWQAWLELNDIFELNDKSQLGLLHGKLKGWATDWINSSVAQLAPLEITDLMLADFKPAKHVAVFLPTSGKLQHAGKAIVDGIMASYHQEQAQSSSELQVSIFDTAKATSMSELATKAKIAGAELIIGPLKKEDVESLKEHMASLQNPQDRLPVLALNYTNHESADTPRHFFEFGLSAEDEAVEVAKYTVERDLTRALILRPNSEWGERVSTAFKEQFEELDGEVLDEASFSEPRQFSKEVQELLGLNESKRRHKKMERKLGKKLDYTPRRRQDVDFIFLLASPNEARQLKPTINYHYGQKIPVFATSHIYDGTENVKFNQDLNNIHFVDIPWILQPDTKLKKTFNKHIPTAQTQFNRLHALGVDAFSLMREFPVLKHVASSELEGATGTLTIQANGRVKRQLSWAKFRKGEVKVIEAAQ